jgi:formamidopyrimidine-DNA glycosylase
MDQTILAGLGNILVTEALWRARIDPRSRGDALSRADVVELARALGSELRRELAVREAAKDGEWEDVFSVYGRTGQPCPRCGAPIRRIVLSGRGTTFCPRCQARRGRRAQ